MGNPVRKIKSRTRGVRGHFFSLKNDRRVNYESLNEQSLMKVLETDPNIIEYCEQPLQLRIVWKGKEYTYTPDTLSKNIFSESVLYEVKPTEDLESDDGRLANKFAVAEEYCLERGWKFKVITEDIRTSSDYRRADMLLPHLMNPSIDMGLADQIFHLIHNAGMLRISDISNTLSWANPRYCTLLHLLGKGLLIEKPYGSFELETEIRVFPHNVSE